MEFINIEFELPLLCTFFIFLLLIVYYSKAKIKLFENKFFEVILISTFFYSIINTLTLFFCSINELSLLNTVYYDLMYFLNVVLVTILYTISLSLLFYNIHISDDSLLTRKKVINSYVICVLIFFISCLFLSVEFTQINKITLVTGSLINFAYSLIVINIIIAFVIAFVNRKKIEKKFLIVIYMLIILFPILFISYFMPELLLQDTVAIFLSYIMFFTIENPDVKMVIELNKAVDAANKANIAKSDFLSSMSHEIRTPLNAVVGLSQDMLEDEELPQKFKEDTADIVVASNTLLEIVGNIIDISKVESQKLEIVNMEYSIKEVIESVLKVNKPRLIGKNINVETKFDENLPERLIGDYIHVKQIVNNLVSNSFKYTKEGNVKISVKTRKKDQIDYLVLKVEDTGIGIKPESINRLFTKFDRLDIEKKSTVEGTGLGLAITKRLLEHLSGNITVNSKYGKGTTFVVEIPQIISDTKEVVIDKNINEKNYDYQNLNILVVDDNELNIKVAKRNLEFFSIKVDTCLSGLEALNLIEKNNYDIILMDIMMPDMDGTQTFKLLKEKENFNIPVIALTADAIMGAESKYKDIGFVSYLSKPFTKDELREKIDVILSNK